MAQVKVTFDTTESGLELPDSKKQLLVPTDIKRYGLSRILNSESMLDLSSPEPFDFLINGTFLRSTLEDYLKKNGLSVETHITLQYVRSLLPPVYQTSFEHEDWVSAVDVLSDTSPAGRWSGESLVQGQERVLSASYDGLLRMWNASGQVVATSPSAGGHIGSIKSAKLLTGGQVVSAGDDRTVRVWKYAENEALTGTFKPALELYGHKGVVERIEVEGRSKRVLSAGTDGSVGLWTTSKTSAPEAPANLLPGAHSSKRRKVSTATSTPQRGPLSMMSIHTAPVSAAVFEPRDRTVGYSASQDHTLRTLDLTTSQVVSTATANHALLSLCAVPQNSVSLLAAGTAARHITLVDPRASSTTTSVMTLRGHANVVPSIATSPDNDFSLVSASHDGTCRVWDLRSTRVAVRDEGAGRVSEPVYAIERESRPKKSSIPGDGYKVFDVVWDKALGIISGGQDRRVQVNQGRGIIENA